LTACFFLRLSVPQGNHNFISRRILMTRISALLFLLVFCSVTAMQAQAPAPKPGPELKKLRAVVGHWTFDGEFKSGPLGPGGKGTGEDNCRMILGGFFFQCQLTGKVAEGEMRLLEIDGYDPVNKNFSSRFYMGDGSTFSGVLTVTGNTWTYEGKWTAAGKEYQYKETFILSPDLTGGTDKSEISVDGKTWMPYGESKWTKTQPPAKK
jgi:hypothetical protein